MLSKREAGMFMLNNAQYFEKSQIEGFTEAIADSARTTAELDSFKFKSPTVATVLSIFLGWLGIDRFYSGNYIMGVIKLCTLGCYGIWWIVDLFLIRTAVKCKNQAKFYSFLTGTAETSSFNTDTLIKLAKDKEVRNSVKNFTKSVKEVGDSFDINK